jgi:hypothetical protein
VARRHGDGAERSCAGGGEGRAVIPCFLVLISDSSDARCQRRQTKSGGLLLLGNGKRSVWPKTNPKSSVRRCCAVFENPVPADAVDFLTNLLARTRYRFILLFLFFTSWLQCLGCRCRARICRVICQSCAHRDPREPPAFKIACISALAA